MSAPSPSEGHARENLIRRLEAFSDIVIGFSLAQLGLNLVIPQHAVDFVKRPFGLVAFIVTFIVVVRFWWTHFKIFRSYFEPNRVMITLNFVALAALIVQVFTLQLYLSFVPKNEGLAAARIYFGTFALAYGALAAMYAAGLTYRRKHLSSAERLRGVRDLLGICGAVLGCVLGNVFSSKSDVTNIMVDVQGTRETVASAPTMIFLCTFAGWLIAIAAGRAAPLLLRRLSANGSNSA